jgi:DNA polymerase III delta prime subunit
MINNVAVSISEGKEVREKRDVGLENVFNRTIMRAESIGRKVNVGKTQMIAILNALTFKPRAYIIDAGGRKIASENDSMKILGFHFGTQPNVSLHVSEMVKKARRRFWVIRHLKRHGLSEEELTQVYCSILRSVLEYCSVVYGPMLTNDQSETIERVQSQALKCIFGFEKSYREILEKTNLETLSQRRENAILKFAKKCIEGRFSHWFPCRRPRDTLEPRWCTKRNSLDAIG